MTVPQDDQLGGRMGDAGSRLAGESETGADVTGWPAGGQISADGQISMDIRFPADPSRLPLLRSVAGALAAAQDYDIDTIADLRMAVDELAATVVKRARPGSVIACVLEADPDGMTVTASSPVDNPTPVDQTTFGWMVLTTLATEVTARVADVDGSGPVVSLALRVTPGRVAR
jgi:serine/threonine-protein kinase RsbW